MSKDTKGKKGGKKKKAKKTVKKSKVTNYEIGQNKSSLNRGFSPKN